MEGKATDVFFVRSIPGQRTPRTVSVSSYEVAGIEYMFANNQSPLRSSLSYLYHIIDTNIKNVRRVVIHDKKAKKSHRIMALVSYLGIYPLRLLGGFYRLLIS